MLRKGLLYAVRVLAAAVVIEFGGGLFGAQPLVAFGTCGPDRGHGCISSTASYINMSCVGGDGTDCLTCVSAPAYVCTWSKGHTDLQDYRGE